MTMKILIMLLFFVLFAGLLTEYSYAEINKEKNKDDIEVFMQTVLRNSDGILVGYTEGTPHVYYPDQLIDWVESRANKSTIIKDGKKFEMLQVETKFRWYETDPKNGFAMGASFLNLPINGQTANILYFNHDSFNTSPGDTAQVFWTMFRPAN